MVSSGQLSLLRGEKAEHASLPAALELACCLAEWQGNHPAAQTLKNWALECPVLSAAFNAFDSKLAEPSGDPWAGREYEFFPITRDFLDSDQHHMFESRFAASLRENGFQPKAAALVGAFHEMADNIVQHSGASSSAPATGIVGYHVSDEAMSFVVGDVGRGIHASLLENPAWRDLAGSIEAIKAVVVEHASRRGAPRPRRRLQATIQISRRPERVHSRFAVAMGSCTSKERRMEEKASVDLRHGPRTQLSDVCLLRDQPQERII